MSKNDIIQINLNSKYATKYIDNNYSNSYFDLPNIIIASQHHIHLSVKNIIIPYSFYNINSTNNYLAFTINNIVYTYTISEGNYNVIQFVKYINILIKLSNLILSYDSIKNKLVFNNVGFNFVLSNTSTCLNFMGISSYNLYSANNKLTGDTCLNMQTVQSIYIKTNFLTGNINSGDLYTQDTLCTIPVTTQPYSNIVFENYNNFTSNLYTNLLNEITIKLTDQNNNIINLNGLHWSLTLQLEIVDFVN